MHEPMKVLWFILPLSTLSCVAPSASTCASFSADVCSVQLPLHVPHAILLSITSPHLLTPALLFRAMRRVLRHSRGLSPVVGQAQRWQRVWASAAAVASTTPGKVKVHITDRDGRTYQGSYDAGLSLMECLRDDGSLPVDLPGTCGGCCQCATCHVLISSEDGWSTRVSAMMPRSEKEEDLLDTLPHVSRNSRLCCQIHLSADVDGVKIIIPPSAVDARMAQVLKRAMPPKP